MISRREGNLDRVVLRALCDRQYVAQRHAAWLRCLEIDREAAQRAIERDKSDREWWTPERERQLVADAEAERDRRRKLQHLRDLAAARKPVERERARKAPASAGNPAEQIRRVK